MHGRELIRAAMTLQDVERVPWTPFVGVHGGALIGVNAADYLRSADHIVNGLTKAVELYRPDGLPIVFDLQLEAEILGCRLEWAAENPPAVVSHPLAEGRTLDELALPNADDGRLPIVLEAARRLRQQFPDLALYGLVTGPFTLALHLLGTEIFMKMMLEPEAVKELFAFTQQVAEHMADLYIDSGADVIAVVDPMTSQIGPDLFRQFVSEPATAIFAHIRSRGALGSFFVCGHAQQNIEAMCECRPDNISVDENIPLDYVREISLSRGVSFGGNLQLTVVLLLGSEKDVRRHVVETLDIGGERGFILAPGCDLPYRTPIANLRAVAELVHDPYQREVARTLGSSGDVCEVWDMSDYGKSDRVIVDIITLDSEACAPCQYMVESVKAVAPQFKDIVVWREHKIKHSESVQFMTSLMVKNIPTICIDGKITFVSRIPPKEELIAAIQRRINEKLLFKIRSRKGALYLFGKTEEELAPLEEIVRRALRETGADIDLIKSCNPEEMHKFGVALTPAAVLAVYKIKAEGTVPQVAAVKEWIKEII
ncbi:MAG: uroporphyrinogen decarboxylase [candidate division KSB1 bacterium]|nr:uroporphyrinogen decarboxylase [candidate division KSB1 bacterium]